MLHKGVAHGRTLPHATQRRAPLYSRHRVQDDLRPVIGKLYVPKSLGTERRREVIILVRACGAHTDDLLQRLRAAPHDRDEHSAITDFGFKPDLNERGRVTSITVTDAKPEERVVLNSAMETALRNLPMPGEQTRPPTENSDETFNQPWKTRNAKEIAPGKQGA